MVIIQTRGKIYGRIEEFLDSAVKKMEEGEGKSELGVKINNDAIGPP